MTWFPLVNPIVVLEAHCDDACLSIGGTLSILKELGAEIQIINIFSSCATTVLRTIKGDYEAITRLNRQEEKEYARKLGANLAFLEFQEALLRGHKRWTCRGLSTSDQNLVPKIRSAIESLLGNRTVTIFSPLAVGNHRDHMIVRAATQMLSKNPSNSRLIYYEDLPYGYFDRFYDAGVRRATSLVQHNVSPILIPISMHEKYGVMRIYKSQYNAVDLRPTIRYGQYVHQKYLDKSSTPTSAAERLWLRPDQVF